MSKKIILISSIIILALAASGSVYFYSQRNTPSSSAPQTVRPVNDVDYSPAKPEDSSGVSSSKEETAKPGQTTTPGAPTTPSTAPAHSVSMTVAEQAGNQLTIRALVNGATGGTCELTLKKSGVTPIIRNAGIAVQASYAICQGFNIPLSDIPSDGEWTVAIVAKVNDKASAPVEKKVTITK